jgi:hypothetical protein
MKTLAVNNQNDLYLDNNGNIAIATGLIATMQACQQAAQTLLGEMVLQTDQGIPYFQVVFNGVPNIAQFEASLRAAFLGVDGVVQVESIDIVQNGDNLGYTAIIQTIYGQGSLPMDNGSVTSNTDLTSFGLTSLDYKFPSETGVIVPDTSTLLNQVTQEYKDIFGEDLNTALNTPQGLLIAAETLARAAVLANNAQIANQINPNLAGGIFFDAIWKLTGGARTANQYTTVGATLTGTPAAVISSGSLAQDNVNFNQFSLVTTVTLDGSGNGTGTFQAVNPGPITVAADTLTIIVAGAATGWETVNNPAQQITIGAQTQPDGPARNTRNATLALQSTALSEAILSALRILPDVGSAAFLENNQSTTQVISGVTMVPNSIYVCVSPDTANATEIANVLQLKTIGIAYNGGTTVNVTDPYSGQVIPVKFDYATEISFVVRVTARQGAVTQDVQTAIIQAIGDYVSGKLTGEPGLTVGQAVSPFELSGACNREFPDIYISKVEISLSGDIDYVTTEIPIDINQIATIVADNITVIILS